MSGGMSRATSRVRGMSRVSAMVKGYGCAIGLWLCLGVWCKAMAIAMAYGCVYGLELWCRAMSEGYGYGRGVGDRAMAVK